MKLDYIKHNKIPLTIATLVCFLIVALMFNAGDNVRENRVITADLGVDNRPVIVLDAGHGGMDGGAVGANGELEKDINLAVVKNLQQFLEFSGFRVVLTRDSDRSMHTEGVAGIRAQKVSDMENRRMVIDAHPNSLFFSIHQNRYTEEQYHGAQMFYTAQNTENARLAQILQDSFALLQPGNDREIKMIENDLYLFKSARQPAVLIECGFLSNPDEAARLGSAEYQRQLAFAIYRGVMQYVEGA